MKKNIKNREKTMCRRKKKPRAVEKKMEKKMEKKEKKRYKNGERKGKKRGKKAIIFFLKFF